MTPVVVRFLDCLDCESRCASRAEIHAHNARCQNQLAAEILPPSEAEWAAAAARIDKLLALRSTPDDVFDRGLHLELRYEGGERRPELYARMMAFQ